jgi:tetratricopeptide (TPR) repeat protein
LLYCLVEITRPLNSHPFQTACFALGEAFVLGTSFSGSRLLTHFFAQQQSQTAIKSQKAMKTYRLRKFALTGTCLAAGLGLWLLPAQAGDDASQLTQEGWRLWQSHHLDEAAAKFRQAVKLAPKNTDAWNGLGWATLNAGKVAEGQKAFQKAIALEPGHPAALNGLGQIYLAQGKLNEAETNLLKAAPQAPAAWYGLARLYLLEAKFEPAEKWAQKVVDSGQADELAKQMLQAAKEKQVSDRLRMQIAPPTAAAPVKEIVSRAWKLMNEGRRVEARKLLETELQKNPSDANAENALGWCLLNGGQPQDAKSHFQKAIQLDPNAAGSMNGLARVYKAEGKDDEAVKLWQQMVDKFPGPHAGTYGLADTYLEKHDFAKALPLLEQLAQANPDDPELKAKLARAAAAAHSDPTR